MYPVSLEISVAAMPGGEELSIGPEVDLIKPALLYGDKSTLYSPHILILHHLHDRRHTAGDDLLADVRGFLAKQHPGGEYADVEQLLNRMEEIRANPSRTPDEESMLQSFDSIPTEFKKKYRETLQPKVDRLLNSTGYKQLRKAMKEGLLTIAPMVDKKTLEDTESGDALIQSYFDHIEMIMRRPGSYPLFDSFSADVVNALITDGRLPQSVTVSKQGKEVEIASRLISRAPTFPKADVYEIIDIRKELRKPLIRFRSASIRLGELVEAPIFGPEFESEVTQLIHREISPAILEIEEATENNRYLKRLRQNLVGQAGTMAGSALTIGIAGGTDFPTWLAAIAVTGAGLKLTSQSVQSAITAYTERQEEAAKIAQREIYFLAQLDRQLATRVQR